MSDPQRSFAGARSKISRANRHIQELVSLLNAFLETEVCRLIIEEDAKSGTNTLCIDGTATFPPDIPLLIGDAVHNLRTALDHIVVQFTGISDNRMALPTGAGRHDVESALPYRTIKKASPKFASHILEEIQPYRGGKFRIWELGKLDNVDKHQLLIPTMNVTGRQGVSLEDDRGIRISGPGFMTVEQGYVSALIGGLGKIKITDHGKPVVGISFGPGTPVEGEAVLEALPQFSQLALQAVESFERFCFGNVPDPNAVSL